MPEAQALQREDGLAEESMAEEPVVAWLKQVACGLPVSIPHFWPHTPFQAGMTPPFWRGSAFIIGFWHPY